MTNFYFKIQRL